MCCMYFVFFFFKQKTAYEMRISDWSSDVCSSDLKSYAGFLQAGYKFSLSDTISVAGMVGARLTRTDREIAGSGRVTDPATGTSRVVLVQRSTSDTDLFPKDRKSVVEGKTVPVSGDLGSRRNHKTQ